MTEKGNAMADDILEAEVVGTDLEIRHAPTPAPAGLFGTDDPAETIEKATKVANVLKGVINQQGLISNIGGKQYIQVEGWTTLGAMLGVFAKVEYTRPLEVEGERVGWEAAVVVVNAVGAEIGRAEAECLRSERNWKGRDDYALRSMAQTRAMGKALRMPLGFIAVLAGYEATPAEEMPIPFEAPPAATNDADEADVAAVLELAGQVGEKTKASKAIAEHRKKFEGRVDPTWLGKMRDALEAKLPPAESMFKAPEGATP